MDPSKLSDAQLYALIMNKDASSGITDEIQAEFDRRNFSIEELDVLDIEYQKSINLSDELLTWKEKVLILAFPFFIPIHAIIASTLLGKGKWRKWREYWDVLALAYGIWLFIIILVARYFPLNEV